VLVRGESREANRRAILPANRAEATGCSGQAVNRKSRQKLGFFTLRLGDPPTVAIFCAPFRTRRGASTRRNFPNPVRRPSGSPPTERAAVDRSAAAAASDPAAVLHGTTNAERVENRALAGPAASSRKARRRAFSLSCRVCSRRGRFRFSFPRPWGYGRALFQAANVFREKCERRSQLGFLTSGLDRPFETRARAGRRRQDADQAELFLPRQAGDLVLPHDLRCAGGSCELQWDRSRRD
jgi:hypothetical protein